MGDPAPGFLCRTPEPCPAGPRRVLKWDPVSQTWVIVEAGSVKPDAAPSQVMTNQYPTNQKWGCAPEQLSEFLQNMTPESIPEGEEPPWPWANGIPESLRPSSVIVGESTAEPVYEPPLSAPELIPSEYIEQPEPTDVTE
jgi:hypothetical protein